jgi:multiple sugar transport system ATP-binding protein
MAQLRNIVKRYDDKHAVIHGIDLDIADGEFVVFVGPPAAANRRCCA